jgi:hypothetical protein
MIRVLAIVCGVLALSLGASGWFLWGQIERNGKLQLSVDSLTEANKAKSNATQSRAKTETAVRSLPPADKREWLRGRPPSPDR